MEGTRASAHRELRDQGHPLLNVTNGGDGRGDGEPLWTPEAIEHALRAFCSGRSVWPTGAEFSAAGLDGLAQAASKGQGHDYWAQLLRIPRGHAGKRTSSKCAASWKSFALAERPSRLSEISVQPPKADSTQP